MYTQTHKHDAHTYTCTHANVYKLHTHHGYINIHITFTYMRAHTYEHTY